MFLFHVQLKLSLFFGKTVTPQNGLLIFLLERDTFLKQIVENFDEKKLQQQRKTWESSRILRVKQNFIFLSVFIFFSIFHFSFFSCFHFPSFSFFFSFIFFHFPFNFFHFLSFSFIFVHFLLLSFIFFVFVGCSKSDFFLGPQFR